MSLRENILCVHKNKYKIEEIKLRSELEKKHKHIFSYFLKNNFLSLSL